MGLIWINGILMGFYSNLMGFSWVNPRRIPFESQIWIIKPAELR
jgi:hypothetical protein